MNARKWMLVALMVGLALRVAAASHGDLWMDEAWSAHLASLAGPVGVFVSLHHDNNHPLNSFWLAIVGPGAPLLMQRLLAVATGTATIWVAARLGARRSPALGVALAFVCALSPMLVQFGSEARGYAPMLLFAMLFLDRVDRFRSDGVIPGGELATYAALGTLSHVVMLPALAAIGLWHLLAGGWRRGWRGNLALFAPSILFAGLVAAILFGGAMWSTGGVTIGSLTPFSMAALTQGLAEVTLLGTGLSPYGSSNPVLASLILAALGCSLLWAPRPGRSLLMLGALLGLSLPIAALLLQPPNVAFARYHLLTGLVLVLLLGWRLATLRSRRAALLLAMPLGAAMLVQNAQMILRAKGEVGAGIDQLRMVSPAGAQVLLFSTRGEAVLLLAAARRSYPVTLLGPDCAPAPFLAAELEPGEQAPASFSHCGARWTTIAIRPAPSPGQLGWLIARTDGVASP